MFKDEISKIGNNLGLEGKFLVDFGFDQINGTVSEYRRLEMENAGLLDLLTEIGNEILMADSDGYFYAEQGATPFECALVAKLNKILGLV